MSLRKLRRIRRGEPITVDFLNRIIDQINQLDFSVADLDLVKLPGMRLIRGGRGGSGAVRKAKLTAELTYAGKSAAGVYWDGPTGSEAAGATITIFRPWTMRSTDDALPSGTICTVTRMDGELVMLTVACPEDPT